MLTEDPTITKVRASYILLRHNFEYITTEFSVPEILEIKDKYIKYAKQILSEEDFAANPSPLCGYCDFLDNCSEGRQKVNPSKIYGEVQW
jgi:hypothetical protein